MCSVCWINVEIVFLRNIIRVKLGLDVVAGPDLNDSTSIKSKFEPIRLGKDFSPSKLRIGIPKVWILFQTSRKHVISILMLILRSFSRAVCLRATWKHGRERFKCLQSTPELK